MNKGFSLIEVLVVLVILGVLAALAVPVLTSQKKEAYRAEALSILGLIRRSQISYFSANSVYSDDYRRLGLTISPGGITFINQDRITTPNFLYKLRFVTTASFCIGAGGRSQDTAGVQLSINQTGRIFDTNIFCL
jgi:prepilin-type N-terminal cleavage/methylation domain-containing protein